MYQSIHGICRVLVPHCPGRRVTKLRTWFNFGWRLLTRNSRLKQHYVVNGTMHVPPFLVITKAQICPMFSSWIQLLSKVILVFWPRSRRSLPQLTTHHNLVYRVPPSSPWRFWCLMQGLGPWCGCGLLHADCLASGAILCYRWLGHLVKTRRDR